MRQRININEKWAFTKDTDEIPKEMPKRWCWVNLPHTWNNIDGQDGNNDYYRGTGYYAKTIKRAELPQADKYFLEILMIITHLYVVSSRQRSDDRLRCEELICRLLFYLELG